MSTKQKQIEELQKSLADQKETTNFYMAKADRHCIEANLRKDFQAQLATIAEQLARRHTIIVCPGQRNTYEEY